MKDNGTPLFWIISQEERIALMDFQHRNFGTKLSIASQKPPWEEVPPVPEIPVNEDSEELRKLMEQPPRIKGRGGY